MDPADIGEDIPKVLRKYNVAALPTVYAGISFRSRVEARWAVFFDALGISYRYEAEGYDLRGVWYLPDFWLPDLKIFIEIKPRGEEPTDLEIEKLVRLAEGTGYPAFLFADDPELKDGRIVPPEAHVAYPLTGTDFPMLWCECPDCGSLGIQWNGFSDRLPCKQGILSAKGIVADKAGCPRHSANRDRHATPDSYRLTKAYQAFRGVRFGR
jgi:hypothetical protein